MKRRGYLSLLGGTFLAGCSGGNSGSNSPRPTDTSTPTETQTATPTPTLDDVDRPEGVSESAVTPDLLTAHQRVVLGKSYTVQWEGAQENRLRRTTIQIGSNAVHQKQAASNASANSFYKDASGGYGRANGGEYYYETSSPIDRSELAQFNSIRAHLAAADYAPTGVVRDGDRLVIEAEATAATVGEQMRRRAIDSIDSYSGTLRIDPSGRILRWTYDWTFSRGGRQQGEEFEYRTAKVGETSVTKPNWLDAAKQQAFSFTPHAPDDGSGEYVAVDIEGGNGALPPNGYASLYTRNGGASGRVDLQLEGGDTLYLAMTGDGLGAKTKPEFGDARPLDGNARTRLSFNGVTVLENATVAF